MRRAILTLTVSLLFTVSANAQIENSNTISQNHTGPNISAQNTEASEAKPAPTGVPTTSGEGRRWAFYVTFSSLFDSNINHDKDDIDDFGLVAGAGIYFRNRPERPTFEFNYEVGQHAYRQTDKWDRTSHNFSARSERRLGRWLVSETSGEVALKGSTEDRELADRYSLKQGLQFRLTRNNRFNLGGAYRIKRYDDDPGRNAINPYVEGGYERRFSGGRKLEASYRYETNRSRNERFRYIRWTYGAEFATPLAKQGWLTVEARYRPQKYARIIEIELDDGDDIEVPRLDRRWIFAAEWKRALRRDLELVLLYKFENRSSNDLDKHFKAHSVGAAFTYRWWK